MTDSRLTSQPSFASPTSRALPRADPRLRPVEFAAGYHARAQSTEYPAEAYDQLVHQGLLGMTLPERLGGQGGDEMAFGIAMEELSWADFNLAELILLPSIAALMLKDTEGAEEIASGIAAGTRHIGFCSPSRGPGPTRRT